MQLIENATAQKLRGGFYTPAPIADFILKWAVNGSRDYEILEPSCGDGVFLDSIKSQNIHYKSVTAIELDEIEAQKAANIDLINTQIYQQDFHTFCNQTDQKYDLVVGNPPYIRYQYFDREQQIEAEKIFNRARLSYSKLTNAWVSFVVGSSLLLKEKGKIGFVLPAEILQVSYAKPLRRFLARFYNKINIVSFKTLVFPDIQQEVILLLCEKNNSGKHHIEHIELDGINDLDFVDMNTLKNAEKTIDFQSNKWTFYFLDQREIDFLEHLNVAKNIPTIGSLASVEVGMTTGANKFFSVPQSIVNQYDLQDYAKPLVGRSVQVKSLRFTPEDWRQNRQLGARANFLHFPQINEMKHNPEALAYIRYGESLDIHKGYKCRIRDEWQIVPSAWISDALFIRRNNRFPKLIVNEAQAYTTDTMHRVKLKNGTNINALCASFYNSLSFAYAEISGRSYGGGVLELMPNEAENILIPYHENHQDYLSEIDDRMRNGTSIDEILLFTNQKMLKDGFGFSDKDIKIANNIWRKLSERRMTRGKKKLV